MVIFPPNTTRRKLVHICCLWKINSGLKIICFENWFVFARNHCVVSVYKKSRKSAAEVTQVTVRDWTEGGLHVIRKLAVVMFLLKTQQQNEELGVFTLPHEKYLQFDWLRAVVFRPRFTTIIISGPPGPSFSKGG